jgi:hypothetical protein
VVGLIIAELIADGTTASPIAPFCIERFAGWSGGPDVSSASVEH